MASHRRAKVPVRSVMTLSTTTVAAAAGVVLAAAPSHADSISDIQTQVSALDLQAEKATDLYDGAMEQLATLQQQINNLTSEAASAQSSMDKILGALGPAAAAQYQQGSMSPTLELMLSSHPDTFLSQASAANEAAQAENLALVSLRQQQAELKTLQAEANSRYSEVQSVESQAAADKQQIVSQFEQAQTLLAQLSYQQQQTFDYSPVTQAQIDALPQVGGRAGEAIAFATAQIGKPYQWGGTGDPSYDCSGLTQAAWAAGGVDLPRVTYDQVDSGYAVPAIEADLEPGDLIFYLDNAHVALYVGNGIIIQAPETGTDIGYADWNELPISAVRRVD
jgi:cell wall-associated NlpC family hydrolase